MIRPVQATGHEFPTHLAHVTLTTGHCHRSPRAEVGLDVIALASELLVDALKGPEAKLSMIGRTLVRQGRLAKSPSGFQPG